MNDLLARARREGTPLIDGDRVIFLVEGIFPAGIVGDHNDWGAHGSTPMHAAGDQLWCAEITLPTDAYIEYRLERDGQQPLDPLNPGVVSNGLGGYQNYFYMPEAPRTVSLQRPTVPRGTITREVLHHGYAVSGGRRIAHFYKPAAEGPYPLLVVLDGNDYRRARLTQILDLLIAGGAMRPVALALLDHGKGARFMEYNCSDATLMFLVQSVLPAAARHLDLVDLGVEPAAHAIAGASMGGLMSLYAALRLPDLFGRVLSQSGAFAFQSMPSHFSVIHDVVGGEVHPLDLRLSWGSYEWLAPACRDMVARLQERGYPVRHREYHGAHNYTAWRDDLWLGLPEMFPPV